MSPSEAKASHTVSQFKKWQIFFEQEMNEFHRDDYLTARVAYEVYQLRVALCAVFKTQLPERKIKDFIPEFEFKRQETAEQEDKTQKEKLEEFCRSSQAIWLGALGLDSNGKPVTGQEPPAGPMQPQEAPPPQQILPQTGQPTGPNRTRVFRVKKG